MNRSIRKAVVIGSGVMGSGIAAHLANSGISCLLLDMVPKELTQEEAAKGLTLDHPAVRSRLAATAIERLKKTTPSPLYVPDFASLITPGNLEDDLQRISDADWVIEAVTENLRIKKDLLSRLEPYWRPGTIVSTNTSGISVSEISADAGPELRKHFMGIHFFNPPRYMKLVEIIPGKDTDPELVSFMKSLCERKLGKGVVIARDTPNFIANRIGIFGVLAALREMSERGFTVEEVDAVTGPAIGRPKSATFRTLDMVGLDTVVHVADNVYEKVTDEAEKEAFKTPGLLREMAGRGWLGEKSGQGFYRKEKGQGGKPEIFALDLASMEYRPVRKVTSGSLEAARMAKGAKEKIQALLSGGDRYSELAWNLLKELFVYSAAKVGEIADSPLDIDNAMKWGMGWELGPFETWEAIGLEKSVARMEKEGLSVPAWVKEWIAQGNKSFYRRDGGKLFYVHEGKYKEAEQRPEHISLRSLKEQGRTIKSNSGASLIDLGDGVACLEFHSPNNAIGGDILSMISWSVDETERNYEGLVIANQGKNFCVGANIMLILMEAQDEEWDEIDLMIRQFQNTMMKLKYSQKPVVAAPHRMTLGGGVEVCLGADRIIAAPETYFGLVEVGVGVIPGGGGCKEYALRASREARIPEADLQPYLSKVFEMIGMAKVSTSGHDALRLGYFQPTDRVAASQDVLIYQAKQEVLRLAAAGYEPPRPEKFRVAGAEGKAIMQLGAIGLKDSNMISDHDLKIAKKLAHVLAGGDVPAGTLVTEQYLLDLEREAFLSLCGEKKTQQRMQHMLSTGKPLRN